MLKMDNDENFTAATRFITGVATAE